MFQVLDSILLMVDLQPRVYQTLPGHEIWAETSLFLLQGAKELGIPTFFTEQTPAKLGPTDSRFLPFAQGLFSKNEFSAGLGAGLLEAIQAAGCRSLVIAGLETHICIQQTALQFKEWDFRVGVVADAVVAGSARDHDMALRRMGGLGIEILTVESILMEWTQSSQHPAFRAISSLLKAKRASAGKSAAAPSEPLS